MPSPSNKSVPHLDTLQLIYAGGTFGSYGRPLSPLDAAELIPVVQAQLQEHARLLNLPETAWLDNALVKDSSQLTAEDFVHFYALLLTAYQAGSRRFVLITGTDTLSYLGAFLAEAFAGSDICVVLTGSMSPLLDADTIDAHVLDAHGDAWDNLIAAIKLASAGESGVKISFGGESWPAQTVQKIHSHDLMAFTGHSRAAYPANSYIKRMAETRRQHWLDDQFTLLTQIKDAAKQATVHALYCMPSQPDILTAQLEALVDRPPSGIILMGFGAGNLPYSDAFAQALDKAYAQGHMVVCASQCPFGGVSDDYAAGNWQYEHHVISGARLTTPAIYARLLWLLIRYTTPARRRQRWSNTVSQTATTMRKR